MQIHSLQKGEKYQPTNFIFSETYEEGEEGLEKGIYCGFCGNLITNHKNKVEIEGKHTHIFTNPHGFIYEIGVFNDAIGCIVYGEPTGLHSWFPPYKWNFALCSRCKNHLGWFYSDVQDSFYGLILAHLKLE